MENFTWEKAAARLMEILEEIESLQKGRPNLGVARCASLAVQVATPINKTEPMHEDA